MMEKTRSLHNYELDIHIRGLIDFDGGVVEAANKEEAAEVFYEKLPEDMKNWTPFILRSYINRVV